MSGFPCEKFLGQVLLASLSLVAYHSSWASQAFLSFVTRVGPFLGRVLRQSSDYTYVVQYVP